MRNEFQYKIKALLESKTAEAFKRITVIKNQLVSMLLEYYKDPVMVNIKNDWFQISYDSKREAVIARHYSDDDEYDISRSDLDDLIVKLSTGDVLWYAYHRFDPFKHTAEITQEVEDFCSSEENSEL